MDRQAAFKSGMQPGRRIERQREMRAKERSKSKAQRTMAARQLGPARAASVPGARPAPVCAKLCTAAAVKLAPVKATGRSGSSSGGRRSGNGGPLAFANPRHCKKCKVWPAHRTGEAALLCR